MGPLVFFVVIIAIDLVLKNARNKKQRQAAQRRDMEELKNKKDTSSSYVGKDKGVAKREVPKNPSIFKSQKESDFLGEGGSYKENHKGYRGRYDDRYEDMNKKYEDIKEGYEDSIYDPVKIESDGLYDPHAIDPKDRKFDGADIRDYGKEKKKINIPVPKASTFKKDILKGIIFSEILNKPKSMKK